MGDTGEFWQDVTAQRQAKRFENRKWSTAELDRKNIPYVSYNNGVHLVVMDRWDFWPSTGRFIDRETGRNGRGVRRLIKLATESRNG